MRLTISRAVTAAALGVLLCICLCSCGRAQEGTEGSLLVFAPQSAADRSASSSVSAGYAGDLTQASSGYPIQSGESSRQPGAASSADIDSPVQGGSGGRQTQPAGSSQSGRAGGASGSDPIKASSTESAGQTQTVNPVQTVNDAITALWGSGCMKYTFSNTYAGVVSRQQNGFVNYDASGGHDTYYIQLSEGDMTRLTYCDGIALYVQTVFRGMAAPAVKSAAGPAAGHLMLVMPRLDGSEGCTERAASGGNLEVTIAPKSYGAYRGVFAIVAPSKADSSANTIQSLSMSYEITPQGELLQTVQHFRLLYAGSPLSLDLTRQFAAASHGSISRPPFAAG